MALSVIVATCTLESLTPYSQSRKHDEAKLEGEGADDYNRRTWRSQQLVENGTVHIPAAGIHQALVAAAKYMKKQIPGQGKATWTKKFEAGIAFFSSIDIGINPETVDYIDIYANADGVRGSGKRVMRRFPIIPKWSATFDVHILDPIITEDIFTEVVEQAGMFVGIGRYRPEKAGTNGRFSLTKLVWQADRKPVIARAA
jgi:hypothetical protein